MNLIPFQNGLTYLEADSISSDLEGTFLYLIRSSYSGTTPMQANFYLPSETELEFPSLGKCCTI